MYSKSSAQGQVYGTYKRNSRPFYDNCIATNIHRKAWHHKSIKEMYFPWPEHLSEPVKGPLPSEWKSLR